MRVLLTIMCAVFIILGLESQSWNSLDENSIIYRPAEMIENINGSRYVASTDINKVHQLLLNAPLEFSGKDGLAFDVPLPDGSMESYKLYYSPVMMEGLSSRYPSIRSYKGISTREKGRVLRLSVSPLGIHAAISTLEGQIYIDPYSSDENSTHVSYFTSDFIPRSNMVTSCGLDAEMISLSNDELDFTNEEQIDLRSPDALLPMRTYRFALACTAGWGQFQTSKATALSKMVAGVNRLNLIFELEIAIRLLLIDNNDELIQMDPSNQPYPSNQGFDILNLNTNVVNSIIGVDNYDLGHVWSNCNDTGGVAGLGVACSNNSKARGVTCIGGFSAVDPVMVSITSHELGHQMGAAHSWNSCTVGLEDQFSVSTSYEPGSGSTIMSYDGACGGNNIQGFSTDKYNVGALNQIIVFTRSSSGESCISEIPTSNNEPQISINSQAYCSGSSEDAAFPDDLRIPINTPFELTATASDLDNDNLTYSWEQYDTGPSSQLGMPLGNAPQFRVYNPTPSPTRVFPRIENIMNGSSSIREVMPFSSRDWTFRCLVRDNNPQAGAVIWDEIDFKSTDVAGPFEVNSIVGAQTIGEMIEVTWEVANTDQAPVNASNVDIFLSTDGGFSYDYILLSETPNDGSEMVLLPYAPTSQARIKVKGHKNIFFDITPFNFSIEEPTTPGYGFQAEFCPRKICLPQNTSFGLETYGFGGFNETINFAVVSGLPPGATASFSANNIQAFEPSSLDLDLSNATENGTYSILIEGSTTSGVSMSQVVTLITRGTDFTSLQPLTPASGSSGVEPVPTFTWSRVVDADHYEIEVSPNPDFGSTSVIFETNLTDTFYVSEVLLDVSTLYFWKVRAINECKDGEFSPLQTLGSQALNCRRFEDFNLPLNISQSGTPTVIAEAVIAESGEISKAGVKRIKGLHDKVSDLKGTLISPTGTEVILWSNKCGNQTNFNVGFDDDSPTAVQCPLNGGPIYRPEGSLADFIGESITGTWSLRLEDTKSGGGGIFDDFELELCSNATLDPPILVNNNVLEVPPGFPNKIESNLLLTTDNNNTAEELVYTLVETPSSGYVSRSLNQLNVGDNFTQDDIDLGRIRYHHNGNTETSDAFYFTVVDGEGGWIDITRYDVEIDASFTSGVDNIDDTSFVQVYPNPADEKINIEISKSGFKNINVMLIDITGKLVYRSSGVQTNYLIESTTLAAGIYTLRMDVDESSFQKKIVVIH